MIRSGKIAIKLKFLLLTLSKQHQRELFQMYEDLTARQHDYKQHLQTLRELVSNDKDSTAEKYLNSVLSDNLSDEMIVTGSPEIDALLTTKRRIMRERGIEFVYVPYPWQVCQFMFRTFVPSWESA